MNRIAFLGLGAMGSRMAANLVAAGFDVAVWNRDPAKVAPLTEKGARAAASPRAAAQGAGLVFSMVRDDDASRAVWLDVDAGALAGMGPDAVAIESSTLSLGWTRALASTVRAHGRRFLDAPVAGSRPQAEARQLIHFVGGDAATLADASPALGAMGGAVHHVGPAGAGMAMKLVVNAFFGVQIAALAELLGALEREGVDGTRAADILGATPVASPAAKAVMASMVARAFAPLFPVELLAKDFAYAVAGAREADATTPIAGAAEKVFGQAIAVGLGARHATAVRELY